MIYEVLRYAGGSLWRQVEVINEAAPWKNHRNWANPASLRGNADDWRLIASHCFIVELGPHDEAVSQARVLVQALSDWGEDPPEGDLLGGSQAGACIWAGIACAVARSLDYGNSIWLKQAAKIEGKESCDDVSKEWRETARLSWEIWSAALRSDQWPSGPDAALALGGGLTALDNAVLRMLREGEGHEDAQPFIKAWREARARAVTSGLDRYESWSAWASHAPLFNLPSESGAPGLHSLADELFAWTYDCPKVVEIVLRVVHAARSRFLMARAPTVASSTLTNLRRGLSPHARAAQRGPRAWELLDAVGNKVAHAEGLDGGRLTLLPAGALLRLVKSGSEKLRSSTGIRIILGICAIARQRAAGLTNASPHLHFNGLEDLVRQCGLPVNKRTIAAAREVVAAGHMWHWADERGGAAGLWTYIYRDDTGGSNGGRISRLTIVPSPLLIPERGERGVLLAVFPMLGSLGAPRLVGGEVQLHLTLCAEIQAASASLREGIGLVCEGETLERLARESGLKVDQVRAAIERWILEGVLSREANGGVLWGDARGEERAFIIDQGEHRRAKSEGGKASVQKRRAAKK